MYNHYISFAFRFPLYPPHYLLLSTFFRVYSILTVNSHHSEFICELAFLLPHFAFFHAFSVLFYFNHPRVLLEYYSIFIDKSRSMSGICLLFRFRQGFNDIFQPFIKSLSFIAVINIIGNRISFLERFLKLIQRVSLRQ